MPDAANTIEVRVNGNLIKVDCDRGKPLSDVIRDDLQMHGTRVGCRNGDCGACTVLIDGAPYKSCLVPCHRASGRHVETLDGLARSGDLHPVQRAFWDSNAFQCGFCLSGHVLCIVALLRHTPNPDRMQVREALAGCVCRCTGYQNIVAAALSAANESHEAPEASAN